MGTLNTNHICTVFIGTIRIRKKEGGGFQDFWLGRLKDFTKYINVQVNVKQLFLVN